MNNPTKISYVFFGSSRFSVIALDEMERAGLLPEIIVTTPDKPQGRKMIMTPNPVKEWALARKISVYDTAKLDAEFVGALNKGIANTLSQAPLFVVASYGKIIPQTVLDIPKYGTLNIHPSLLPKYRGASPLQSAMLDDTKDTGVSIMVIDVEMDHGPIIVQENVHIDEWPTYEEFEERMAKTGAKLLVKVLPEWVSGKILATSQNHIDATFTKKIKKEDGLIDYSVIKSLATASLADQYLAYRKIQAFHEWPQAYFQLDHNSKIIRVKITEAQWSKATEDGQVRLKIEKVIPEGSKEISFSDFLRGYIK